MIFISFGTSLFIPIINEEIQNLAKEILFQARKEVETKKCFKITLNKHFQCSQLAVKLIENIFQKDYALKAIFTPFYNNSSEGNLIFPDIFKNYSNIYTLNITGRQIILMSMN